MDLLFVYFLLFLFYFLILFHGWKRYPFTLKYNNVYDSEYSHQKKKKKVETKKKQTQFGVYWKHWKPTLPFSVLLYNHLHFQLFGNTTKNKNKTKLMLLINCWKASANGSKAKLFQTFFNKTKLLSPLNIASSIFLWCETWILCFCSIQFKCFIVHLFGQFFFSSSF